ncbi:MAG: hypothetical protein ACYCOU_22525 [Sulfobacillus sp.]
MDILGFGSQTMNRFDATVAAYDELLTKTTWAAASRPDTTIRIFSDTMIIGSRNLVSVVMEVRAMLMFALYHNLLVRGGIGYGQHVEVADQGNLYVVSQALVQAVELEKRIKKPCVAIHEEVTIPVEWWAAGVSNFLRPVLYYDDIRLVNPFNIMWGHSAMTRVEHLAVEYPDQSEKYLWFLDLYKAVNAGALLVPHPM